MSDLGNVFRTIFDLLNVRERRQFLALVALMMVMGLFNVLGVASVLPFLAVISDPSVIDRSTALTAFRDLTGAVELRDFMIILGVAVFLFVLFTTLVRAVTFYAMTHFTKMRALSLATQLMERYLAQPYPWFLGRHSADLAKAILSEVAQVVNGAIAAAMRLLANCVMIVFLVVFLVFIEPAAAFGAAVLFGGSYGLVYLTARRKLIRMGQERVEANRAKYQIVQEAMGGIKTVKLMSLERSYIERFQVPASRLARNEAALEIISEMPRHLLEVIAFGGMILFVLWLLASRERGLADVIPILGVYAFAGARMFPTIQQLFGSLSALRFGKPALDQLHRELTESPPAALAVEADLQPIPLRETLELDRVGFAFSSSGRSTLTDLSLSIRANTTVGIAGATGAGKTTLVDLILGLLTPQTGALKVDGRTIEATNVRAWQKSVGYVPQDIFLVDDSIAANIAFGRKPEAIDRAAVEAAARVAELHEFIDGLPRGYDTHVGERGVRLSGGQRQRIGIARAVYGNPDVLVFDEATSALDTLTERAVMEAVRAMGHTRTIIMIAHRLSTLRDCDTIFLLDGGRLVDAGTYEDLVERNPSFRLLHEAADVGRPAKVEAPPSQGIH